MFFPAILVLVCLCSAPGLRAASVAVGDARGWTLGVDYEPIAASVGDELVTHRTPGQ